MKIKKIIPVLLFTTLSNAVIADGHDKLRTHIKHTHDSDDKVISSKILSYTNGFAEFDFLHHSVKEDSEKYNAKEINIKNDYSINSDFTLNWKVGLLDIEEDKRIIPYDIGLKFAKKDRGYLSIGSSYDSGIGSYAVMNEKDEAITHRKHYLKGNYFFHKKVKIEGKYENISINSGNRADKSRLGAFYGISPGWPYIWTGVEWNYLDFQEEEDGYWTPEKHHTVSGAFTASMPVNSRWNFSSSFSVGRGKGDDEGWATVGYSSLGLGYKEKETTASVNMHYIKSKGETSEWKERGLFINLTQSW